MSGSTTLTVWVYDSALGAAAGEVRLKDLEQRNALVVHDAVTVTWFPGAHEPRVGYVRHRTVLAAGRGSALGLLLGAVVVAPVAGAVAGAGAGALLNKARRAGIERSFLDEMKARLAPGRSALVVLSSEADPETVMSFVSRGLARGDVELLVLRLGEDAPDALRELAEEAHPGDDSGSAHAGKPPLHPERPWSKHFIRVAMCSQRREARVLVAHFGGGRCAIQRCTVSRTTTSRMRLVRESKPSDSIQVVVDEHRSRLTGSGGRSPRARAEMDEHVTIAHRLRPTGVVAVMLLLYFVVPVDAHVRGGVVLRIVASVVLLVGLAALVLAQIRLSLGSPDRRIDGLVGAIIAVWVAFALGFYVLHLHQPQQIEGLRTRLDALYFAASTTLTVGYGDIHATGQVARALVLVQMAFNVVFVAAAASLLTSRLRRVASASHVSGETGERRGEER